MLYRAEAEFAYGNPHRSPVRGGDPIFAELKEANLIQMKIFDFQFSCFDGRVTRVIRTRSNGAISAFFGLSSLEYRRIPASSAPKISANFIRLSPIGFSDEQIVVPARQSPQVLLYVTARGLTKQERRDAVRKRGSDNSRYPKHQFTAKPIHSNVKIRCRI